MNASINKGIIPRENRVDFVELVLRNDVEDILTNVRPTIVLTLLGPLERTPGKLRRLTPMTMEFTQFSTLILKI
jgi:hypothetical protein